MGKEGHHNTKQQFAPIGGEGHEVERGVNNVKTWKMQEYPLRQLTLTTLPTGEELKLKVIIPLRWRGELP